MKLEKVENIGVSNVIFEIDITFIYALKKVNINVQITVLLFTKELIESIVVIDIN